MINVFDAQLKVVKNEINKRVNGIKLMETSGKLCYCFSFGGFSYDSFEDLIFIDVFTGEEIENPNIEETHYLAGIERQF